MTLPSIRPPGLLDNRRRLGWNGDMSSAKPRDALSPSARSLFFTQSLPVVTLLNLALAARLYEMLGRQPAFFVVRRAEAIDLIALAAIFSLLLPAAVAICIWGIGLAWRPLGQAAFALVVAAAMTAIVLPLVVRSPGSPAALLWTALAGGLLAAGAYFRFAAVRRLVAFLWPATLLLPGLFLFVSPAVRRLAMDQLAAALGRERDPAGPGGFHHPRRMLRLDAAG